MLDGYTCKSSSPLPGLHQRAGRLARPHRLTTPRTNRPSALAAGSRVHAGLRRGEQFARPHRRTTLRPTHPFAPSGDSSMVDFSFTMVTINSMVDNFWPNISGDIYLSLFLTHCFCQKNSYFGPYILICRTIIHYKTWLWSTRGNVLPGVRPCHITRRMNVSKSPSL